MIIHQLFDLIRAYRNDFKPDRDEFLEDYLERTFRDEVDEFDVQGVERLLKELISESSAIPGQILLDWIVKTRLSIAGDVPKVEKSVDCVDTLLKLIPVVNQESRVTITAGDKSKPHLTDEERQAYAERYGFSSKARSKPPPVLVSKEAESKVRYLDGKVVSTSGARYIEVKKEYPDMPQPTFLKSGRKYRFH